ncbi:hypothetical protein MnTg03_00450 [bacterium MnTg03]|nr:hypothetical protein MnTg03_00450 [bacterium MnTg03]
MKPVLENNLMGDQFFLTRQTANLLEDFTREINKGSSLFLLYGIKSVGKSRLLRELTNRGIPGRKFCWIDFKTENVESSIQTEVSDADADGLTSDIQELMEVADERDIIIVDHFELASNKAKHQLFHSWTTAGINKKINLIVIATTGSFDDLREFALNFKVQVKSFELMPCSMAEVEAFLAFYLFPKNPLSTLSIPADIEKQLRSCNGILSEVVEVANQQGKQVSIKPDSDPELKNRAPLAIGTLLVILIALGISYPYWAQRVIDDDILPPITEKTITIISDNEDIVAINYPDSGQSNPVAEARESATSPQIDEPKQEGQSVSEPIIQATVNNASKEKLSLDLEPTPIEPAPGKADQPEELVVKNEKQQLNRFQRDLDNALHWIEGQDKNLGTIQVMMISSKNFNGEAYYSYLDRLESKKIDVSKFRIYQISSNGSVEFGVIYGVYESRREAYQNIKQLPEALKSRGPIPRTIGGIWNEINNR